MPHLPRPPRGGPFVAAGCAAAALCVAVAVPSTAGAAYNRHEPVAESSVERFSEMRSVPRERARSILQAQKRGYDLGDVLERRLGADYAGIWFDNVNGRYKIPLVGGRGGATAEQAIADRRMRDEADVVPAEYTLAELTAAQAQVTTALRDLLSEQLVSTGIDPKANRLALEVSEDATAEQRRRVDAVAATAGPQVSVRERPASNFAAGPDQGCVLQGARSGCHRPFRMGVAIFSWANRSAYCTAGAKARDSAGNTFVFTAGHCIRNHSEWGAFDTGQPTLDTQQRYLGWSSGYLYNGYGDGGRVHVQPSSWWNGTSWVHGHVGWGMYDYRDFRGKARPQYGQVGCHQGARSGLQCGTVDQVQTSVTYSDGTTLGNMTRWRDACGMGGDSGGPWEWEWVIFSLHSGSNGCPTGTTRFAWSFDIAHAEFSLTATVLIGQ